MRKFILLITLIYGSVNALAQTGITISPENPRFWSFDGQLVLLLGGSIEDNLFQVQDLEQHLELMSEVGANYVRCTMSSRDEGDVWPFAVNDEGKYNLNQFKYMNKISFKNETVLQSPF